MHHNRDGDGGRFLKMVFSGPWIISDRAVRIASRGRQEGHEAPETEARDADLARGAIKGARRRDSIHNVGHASLKIIGVIQRQSFCPFRVSPMRQIEPRLLAPEK